MSERTESIEATPRTVVMFTTRRDVVVNHVVHEVAGTRIEVDAATAASLASAGVAEYPRRARIRVLRRVSVGSANHEPGDEVDADDETAGRLVGGGDAELCPGERLGPAGDRKRAEWEVRSAPASGIRFI